MVTVYLDVLIITNMYVNYFLIKSTAKLTHTALNLKRCVLSAFLGSFSALIIILPDIIFPILLIIKLFIALVIVTIAFSDLTIRRLIKLTIVFYTINFLYAGFMEAIYRVLDSSIVVVNNSTVYISIPVLMLAVTTIFAYIAICVFSYVFEKNFRMSNSYKIIVEYAGQQYLFNGICDTGNNLTDTFSSKPVIVCNSRQLSEILDLDLNSNDICCSDIINRTKGLRLLSYNTIKGSGIIPVVKPDKIYVKDEKNSMKPVDAYLGIIFNEGRKEEAVFNPSILI